jgi:hypothetical protein
MNRMFAIVVFAASLGIAGPAAHAQTYVVNGHAASPAEVQRLVSYGAQPGQWLVDGYGISSAQGGQNKQSASRNNSRKCWYVLDVLLCE